MLGGVYFRALNLLKRASLLVLGAMLLTGAALMLVGGLMVWSATSSWPRTEGRIQKAELTALAADRSRASLELDYEYQVEGETLVGHGLSPLQPQREVETEFGNEIIEQFKPGEHVEVYYDPANPSRSFLKLPDLFWDVLFYPAAVSCLAAWMLFLFVKTRSRKVPRAVAEAPRDGFSDQRSTGPLFESVVDREYVVIKGTATHCVSGGLFTGWPSCRMAVIASPNHFTVVPGPYTNRGLASSLLTMVLELSLGVFWLPLAHGTIFAFEMWRRHRHWQLLESENFEQLADKKSGVLSVSIDDAVIYGFDDRYHQLWYRIPGYAMDEFVRVGPEHSQRAEEFIAFVGLMQQAAMHDPGDVEG